MDYKRTGKLIGRTSWYDGDAPTNMLDKDTPDPIVQPSGTRMVAVGENVLSPAVNRGMAALAANCDTLKNYFERNIAEPFEITLDNSGGAWTGLQEIDLASLLDAGTYIFLDKPNENLHKAISILDEHYDEIIVLPTEYGYGYGYGDYSEKLQVVNATIGGNSYTTEAAKLLCAASSIMEITRYNIKSLTQDFGAAHVVPGCIARITGSVPADNDGYYLISKVDGYFLELGVKLPDTYADEFWTDEDVKQSFEDPVILDTEATNKGQVTVYSDGWFFHRPKLILNIPIPDVEIVRVLLGERRQFSWLSPNTLLKVKIRAAEEVAASTQKKIWQIKWGNDDTREWDEDLPENANLYWLYNNVGNPLTLTFTKSLKKAVDIAGRGMAVDTGNPADLCYYEINYVSPFKGYWHIENAGKLVLGIPEFPPKLAEDTTAPVKITKVILEAVTWLPNFDYQYALIKRTIGVADSVEIVSGSYDAGLGSKEIDIPEAHQEISEGESWVLLVQGVDVGDGMFVTSIEIEYTWQMIRN